MSEIENALAEYKDLLTFEQAQVADKGTFTLVRAKQYMHGKEGKETWYKINEIVKGLGGEWVSLGKESHWRVPLVKKTEGTLLKQIQRTIQVLRELEKELENK